MRSLPFSRIVRFLSILLILPAAAAPAGAVQRTAGALTVVVLLADGAPSPGAEVRAVALLDGSTEAAVAGPDGVARFGSLSARAFLVTAKGPSGASAPPVEVVVPAGGDATVDLVLSAAAIQEDVVVSASGAPRAGPAFGVDVPALSEDELARRGETSLLEAIRGLPGLVVRQDGGPGRLAAVQIRGLPASATAVVLDGAPIRDPVAVQADARSLLPSIDLAGVGRIEIRKGGGSPLYGTNAMGGVIHVTTRGPAGRFREGAATLGVGTRGQRRARFDWSGSVRPDSDSDSSGFDSDSSGSDSDSSGFAGPGNFSLGAGLTEIRRGGEGEDDGRFSNRNLLVRGGLRPSNAVRMTARALFGDASVGLDENPLIPGDPAPGIVDASPRAFLPGAPDPDAVQETRLFAGLLSTTFPIGPRATATLRFQELRSLRRNTDGPEGPGSFEPSSPETTEFDGRIRGGAVRIAAGSPSLRLLAGGDVEWERAATRNPASDADLRQVGGGALAQAELSSPDGRAQALGSLRYQWFATDAPTFAPAAESPWPDAPPPPAAGALVSDVAASFAANESLRIRAHWGRGFRAPSLYERFGTFYSSFGYSVFGDPRLEPEFTDVLDFGVDLESPGRRAGLHLAGFFSGRRRIIGFGPIADGPDEFGRFQGYGNVDGGSARGLEAGLRLALPAGVRARAQYTFTDSDPPSNAPPDLESAWLVPRGLAALLAGGTHGPFEWAADLHLSSAFHAPLFHPTTFATHVFRFPGMRRLDLAASWEIVPGLRLRAHVEDALDAAAYQSAGFRPLGRAIRIGLGARF